MSPDYVLLFVDDPIASGEFYADLLGGRAVESSATFVLFVLPSGLKLGLWSRHTAEPKVYASGGGSELAFAAPDRSVVNDLYADWAGRGLAIAQRPTTMDFGYTFVALDRDGHRLRVLALEA